MWLLVDGLESTFPARTFHLYSDLQKRKKEECCHGGEFAMDRRSLQGNPVRLKAECNASGYASVIRLMDNTYLWMKAK